MTTANQLTLLRILLIPVFIGFAVYYGQSCAAGAPEETWRWAAVATFILAAGTDGLDGWLARHRNQRTRLGTILDPIADKGLMISALLTLSLSAWPEKVPLWFPLLVITRDVLAIGGALLLAHFVGLRELSPHWTGKVATFGQITALGAVMLKFPPWFAQGAIWFAALFTFASGMVYLATALTMMKEAE